MARSRQPEAAAAPATQPARKWTYTAPPAAEPAPHPIPQEKPAKLRRMLLRIKRFVLRTKTHGTGTIQRDNSVLKKRKFSSRPSISEPQVESLQVNLLQVHRTHSFKRASPLATRKEGPSSLEVVNPRYSKPALEAPALKREPSLHMQSSGSVAGGEPRRPSLSRAPPPFPTNSPYIQRQRSMRSAGQLQRPKRPQQQQQQQPLTAETEHSTQALPAPTGAPEPQSISAEALEDFKVNPFSLLEKITRWSKTSLFTHPPETPPEVEEDQGSFITEIGTSVSRIHLQAQAQLKSQLQAQAQAHAQAVPLHGPARIAHKLSVV